MKFAYETDTGRITRRYWGDLNPRWFTAPSKGVETAAKPAFNQSDLRRLRSDAAEMFVAGEDYDPDVEEVITFLVYDPSSGNISGDAEVVADE